MYVSSLPVSYELITHFKIEKKSKDKKKKDKKLSVSIGSTFPVYY